MEIIIDKASSKINKRRERPEDIIGTITCRGGRMRCVMNIRTTKERKFGTYWSVDFEDGKFIIKPAYKGFYLRPVGWKNRAALRLTGKTSIDCLGEWPIAGDFDENNVGTVKIPMECMIG